MVLNSLYITLYLTKSVGLTKLPHLRKIITLIVTSLIFLFLPSMLIVFILKDLGDIHLEFSIYYFPQIINVLMLYRFTTLIKVVYLIIFACNFISCLFAKKSGIYKHHTLMSFIYFQ
jgi:hypothetical protein